MRQPDNLPACQDPYEDHLHIMQIRATLSHTATGSVCPGWRSPECRQPPTGGSLRVRRYAHHGRRPAQAGAARPLSTPQDTAAAGRAVTRCSQARGAKQAHPHLPQLPCTSAGGGANSEHFAEFPMSKEEATIRPCPATSPAACACCRAGMSPDPDDLRWTPGHRTRTAAHRAHALLPGRARYAPPTPPARKHPAEYEFLRYWQVNYCRWLIIRYAPALIHQFRIAPDRAPASTAAIAASNNEVSVCRTPRGRRGSGTSARCSSKPGQ